MATRRDLLANDPNVPAEDQDLVRRAYMRAAMQGDEGGIGLAVGAAQARRRPGRKLSQPERAMLGEPQQTAPQPKPRPKPGPDTEAQANARQLGKDVSQYMGERKQLAPGVRRWGSKTADPSDVYMSVDANGNRVYTDDAEFAASRSKGSLSRRDMAPGMLGSDIDRTLNDPDGGMTYAPAGASQIMGGRMAEAGVQDDRALREALRADEIAATRAGSRDIDKRRASEGRRIRRQMGLEDPEGEGMDPKLLIALERLNMDRQKMENEEGRYAREDERNADADARAEIKDATDLIQGVIDGSVPPDLARDLAGTLPKPAQQKVQRALARKMLQDELKDEGLWFGLGQSEIELADLADVSFNEDGSSEYVEPKSGFFDWARRVNLSPERTRQMLGTDEASRSALMEMIQEERASRLRR